MVRMQNDIQRAAITLHNSVVCYNAAISMGEKPPYGTVTSATIMTHMCHALKRYLSLPGEQRPHFSELLYPLPNRSIVKHGWPISEINPQTRQELWLSTGGQLLIVSYESNMSQVHGVRQFWLSELEQPNEAPYSIEEVIESLQSFCNGTPSAIEVPESRLIVAPLR